MLPQEEEVVVSPLPPPAAAAVDDDDDLVPPSLHGLKIPSFALSLFSYGTIISL